MTFPLLGKYIAGCILLIAFGKEFPAEQEIEAHKISPDGTVITRNMWIVPKRNEEGTISEETRLQIMNFLEQ